MTCARVRPPRCSQGWGHADTPGKSVSEQLRCASTGAVHSCIPEVSGLWSTHFQRDAITASSQSGSTLLKRTINLI